MADKQHIDAASAFLFSEELDANLGDALEYMPNSPAVMGQGLPVGAYSAGDTTGEYDRPLPTRLLASLPSKVTRRYSPIRAEDASNSAAAPSPTFAVLSNKSEDAKYQMYPAPPIRVASIAALLDESSRTQVSPNRRAMIESQAQGLVAAPQHAAALLERLGLPIPKEAIASAAFTERGKKAFGVVPPVQSPKMTDPKAAPPISVMSTSQVIVIPKSPVEHLDSRNVPVVTIPTGLTRSTTITEQKSITADASEPKTDVKKKLIPKLD